MKLNTVKKGILIFACYYEFCQKFVKINFVKTQDKINFVKICGYISRLSILFHWSVLLFIPAQHCLDYVFVIPVHLIYNLSNFSFIFILYIHFLLKQTMIWLTFSFNVKK